MHKDIVKRPEQEQLRLFMKSVIELRKVVHSYDDQTIIKELNLSIPTGSFTTLLGPSGCGKTTLLKLMSQLEQPTSGEVWVSPDVKDIRMMFQEYALFPWRTCFENVMLGLNCLSISKTEKEDKARHWLEVVGLLGHENKYPKELSGGMKQRVALAQALAAEAKVILMDEPL